MHEQTSVTIYAAHGTQYMTSPYTEPPIVSFASHVTLLPDPRLPTIARVCPLPYTKYGIQACASFCSKWTYFGTEFSKEVRDTILKKNQPYVVDLLIPGSFPQVAVGVFTPPSVGLLRTNRNIL